MRKETKMSEPVCKPVCKLIGTDGNIFALMGRVSKTMRKAWISDKEIKKMQNEVMNSESYSAALRVLSNYVVIE